jgi:hypothetical protein
VTEPRWWISIFDELAIGAPGSRGALRLDTSSFDRISMSTDLKLEDVQVAFLAGVSPSRLRQVPGQR